MNFTAQLTRRTALVALVALAGACVAPDAPGALARRGALEAHVKSSYPGILAQIRAGSGPDLAQAFDLAGIAAADRPARITQLQGNLPLYEAGPGALVGALALYGAEAPRF